MGTPDVVTRLVGDLRISTFDFAKAGDVFGVHVHTSEDSNHISVVARGRIICQGAPGIEGVILETGAVVDWPLNKEHGFTAMDDNTRLVNIQKQLRVE